MLPENTSTKEMDFNYIMIGSDKTLKIHIYDRGTHDLRFMEAKVLLDKDFSDGLEASVEFIHWGGLMYTGDVMTDMPIAPGDYIALINVKASLDCPLKIFKGTLVIVVKQGREINKIEIPINGKIMANHSASQS